MRTASAAIRSASAAVRTCEEANPHAPSTRTRTPNPSLSPDATPSTRPLLMEMLSSSRRTTRASAYPAPCADAVSSARSVRSDMPAETSRGRSSGHWGVCPSRRRHLAEPGRRVPGGRLLEGRRARHSLDREVEPKAEDEDGSGERDESTGPPERRAGVDAIQAPACEDQREADPAPHERHPEPERDHEQEAERRPPRRDRSKQDQESARRRDQTAGQAEDEEAAPRDGRADRGKVGVGDAPMLWPAGV